METIFVSHVILSTNHHINADAITKMEKTLLEHFDKDFANVEKAILRLFDNKYAISSALNYTMQGKTSTYELNCSNWIRQFSYYLRGINPKTGLQEFSPKSLLHKHCTPIFLAQNTLPNIKKKTVHDLALDIVRNHVEFIAILAIKHANPDLDIHYLPRNIRLGNLFSFITRDNSYCFAVRKDIDETKEYDEFPTKISKQRIRDTHLKQIITNQTNDKVSSLLLGIGFDRLIANYNIYRRYETTTG